LTIINLIRGKTGIDSLMRFIEIRNDKLYVLTFQ